MPTSRTEYILGRNSRLEARSCTGHSDSVPPTNVQYVYGPLRAYIKNHDLQYGFEIDLEAGVYTAWRTDDHGSPAWIKPRLVARPERSGSTVHNHIETIHSGDRRTIFGYTARRVITKTTSRRDGELLSESESDGWYIDPPAAWLNLHPPIKAFSILHCVGSGTNKRDDFTFTEKGERETGFPVLVVRVNRSYFRDQNVAMRSHEHSSRDQITEFSEVNLDAALFVPSWECKRVTQLPGGTRYPIRTQLRFRWEMLKGSRHLRKNLALLRQSGRVR